jgi:hypothetical protein
MKTLLAVGAATFICAAAAAANPPVHSSLPPPTGNEGPVSLTTHESVTAQKKKKNGGPVDPSVITGGGQSYTECGGDAMFRVGGGSVSVAQPISCTKESSIRIHVQLDMFDRFDKVWAYAGSDDQSVYGFDAYALFGRICTSPSTWIGEGWWNALTPDGAIGTQDWWLGPGGC